MVHNEIKSTVKNYIHHLSYLSLAMNMQQFDDLLTYKPLIHRTKCLVTL